MKRVTIVVPCYNEAERLDTERFASFSDDRYDVRFLFVNDGSTDETQRVLEGLRNRASERVEVLCLPKNRGKAEAVRQGIVRAFSSECDYVGFWDADLATPLSTIPEFCDFLDSRLDIEAVIGSRVKLLGRQVERSTSRHYAGRVFATTAAFVLDIQVYDTQCGAKLFRATPEWARIFSAPFSTRWIFDIEIIARLRELRRGTSQPEAKDVIYEYPLMVWRDVEGSKVRLKDFVRSIADMARIWKRYGRGKGPKKIGDW